MTLLPLWIVEQMIGECSEKMCRLIHHIEVIAIYLILWPFRTKVSILKLDLRICFLWHHFN